MMAVSSLSEELLPYEYIEQTKQLCGIYQGYSTLSMKNVSDSVVHFKILVPGIAAGAIIGKGGETIATLQKETGARVKMSKANDFYPGTCERICLMTGCMESVLTALRFIQEKIREKPDPSAKPAIDFDSKLMVDRDRQVKILVPNSTAGMVIGKAGNFIKQIKEESGAYVQISQKAKDQSLVERCITVIGDMQSCQRACMMILCKVAEDPQSGSCLNVSYADVTGPVANYNPTGSPFACTPTNSSVISMGGANSVMGGASSVGAVSPISMSHLNNSPVEFDFSIGNCTTLMTSGPQLELRSNPSPSRGVSVSPHTLEHIFGSLRVYGYTEQSASQVIKAIETLSLHGIMRVSMTCSQTQSVTQNASALLTNGHCAVFTTSGSCSVSTCTPTTNTLPLVSAANDVTSGLQYHQMMLPHHITGRNGVANCVSKRGIMQNGEQILPNASNMHHIQHTQRFQVQPAVQNASGATTALGNSDTDSAHFAFMNQNSYGLGTIHQSLAGLLNTPPPSPPLATSTSCTITSPIHSEDCLSSAPIQSSLRGVAMPGEVSVSLSPDGIICNQRNTGVNAFSSRPAQVVSSN